MNWRTSLWLAGAAILLGLFILAVERPARLGRAKAQAQQRIVPGFTPSTITSVRIRTTNAIVELARTNDLWEVRNTERHPARADVIEDLLQRVASLQGRSILTTSELRTRPQATTDFGLNPPFATLSFESPSGRVEMLVGVHSLNNAQVYYQVPGVPGIFATDAALVDRLPRTAEAWRDATLLPLDRLLFDRIRVTAPGAAFSLSKGASNGQWELTEPRPARADPARIGMLLRQLGIVQVSQFMSATSAPAADVVGLRPPRLALTLSRGSNDIFQLAFGAARTNRGPATVYAQRQGEQDLLIVPAEAHEILRISYKDLLDRRLLRFDRGAVQEIAVTGPDSFRLVWQEEQWRVFPPGHRADPQLVARLFNQLATLEMIDVAKEVVTDLDLATYGLAPPVARLALRTRAGDTNAALVQLEIGALRDNRTFARVVGEAPVYLVNPGDLDELPKHPWELRDRELWRFDSTQVLSVTAHQHGTDWVVRHPATNEWTVAPGVKNELNPFALEEAVHRFGETRILAWRGLGETRAASLGVSAENELTLDFRNPPARAPLKLRLGKSSPAGNRYASTTLPDGTQPVFELEGTVFESLWHELGVAPPANSP